MARTSENHAVVTDDGGRIPINPLREGTHWLEDPTTGCWNWQQFLLKGYARHRFGQAHRVVFRQFGGAIPEGWDLHHRCENPRCVNPDHMEPREKVGHGRHHWAGRIKLTQGQIAEIRELGRNPAIRQRQIAEMFGITRSMVSTLLNGQSWAAPGQRFRPEGRVCELEGCDNPVEGRRDKALLRAGSPARLQQSEGAV